MIKYKSIKTPETAKEYLNMLKEFWEDNRSWQQDKFWLSIFYKKVTTAVETKTKLKIAWVEFTEFINEYRTIKTNWSYDERLITKYNNILKEYKHKGIMKNLSDYKKHLLAFNKPALQVWTYLNQKRFLDNWELIKIDYSKKWIDDLFKERNIPQNIIEPVLIEIERREKSNPKKELTIWIIDNMILKYK